MNSTHPPVLIVGAGLVAALTLDKDPNPRIGQCGTRTWPRFLELLNFLIVPEVNDLGKRLTYDLFVQARDVGPSEGMSSGPASLGVYL